MAEPNCATDPDVDTVVIGAGPAGLAAAIALAVVGCRTVCAGQARERRDQLDTRTTALLQPSVRFLKNIGVWSRCAHAAAPLESIRIFDDTGGLLRAPDVEFRAGELGPEPFGYNISNDDLVAALVKQAQALPRLEMIKTARAALAGWDVGGIHIATDEGRAIHARLAVAADGSRSAIRSAAGIRARSWSYPQTAIACNFRHSEPHRNASNEFHRPPGPFTSVPLPGRFSSLVWVERPEEASRLMALDDKAIAGEIEARLHGVLGSVSAVGPRAAFPLAGLTPSAFARKRVALVGEAAHVMPPIGAQGLNLGFRDAAALAECAVQALAEGRDPGADAALDRYHRMRRADVLTRTVAVDLLNRSLISGFLPFHAARGAGLQMLKSVAPLRRLVMRLGIAPEAALPALMRSAHEPAAPGS